MQEFLFDDIPVGAIITEIKPLPSDPNMRRVRVGKKTVATLRSADVESLKLDVGVRWTMPLAKSVHAALLANKTRKAAMNLLGRRALSRGELIDRLSRKGHDAETSNQIADELADDHWLDDAAYGRSVIHELSRAKPAGRQLLRRKLESRKIESDLIDQLTNEAAAEQDSVQAAIELAKRRMKMMHGIPKATAHRRLAGVLARRGFDEDTIQAALTQVLGNSVADD